MTKIAIISQAEQGVLIDISGCSSLVEAKQYLTSTLQVSSQFWEGLVVDLNLGPLVLTPEQVNEIQAIVSEVGVQPRQIFSLSPITRNSLLQCRLPLGGVNQLHGYASMKPLESSDELSGEDFATAVSENHIESELGGTAIRGLALACASEPGAVGTLEDLSMYIECEKINVELPDLNLAVQSFTLAPAVLDLPEPSISRLSMPNHHITKISNNPVQAPQKQIEKTSPATKPASPAVLMMKQTLRSGQSISHRGHLVIIGDVNPGAELVADGDITVWGALRGVAHAGAGGNNKAEIRALKFDAIQLRIANAIARSPDRNKTGGNMPSGPEVARVIDGKIRLSVSDPE